MLKINPSGTYSTPFTNTFYQPRKSPPRDTLKHERALLIGVKFTRVNWILVFLETLNLFHIIQFSTIYYFYEPLSHTKKNAENLNTNNRQQWSLRCTYMFPIMFFYHSMKLPSLCHDQSLNYFSQSIKNTKYQVNFILWLVFFKWTETACSLCWCNGSPKHWSCSAVVYL